MNQLRWLRLIVLVNGRLWLVLFLSGAVVWSFFADWQDAGEIGFMVCALVACVFLARSLARRDRHAVIFDHTIGRIRLTVCRDGNVLYCRVYGWGFLSVPIDYDVLPELTRYAIVDCVVRAADLQGLDYLRIKV